MYKITFEYKDVYTLGRWRTQSCVVDSIKECIEIYGLNEIEYRIISVEKV